MISYAKIIKNRFCPFIFWSIDSHVLLVSHDHFLLVSHIASTKGWTALTISIHPHSGLNHTFRHIDDFHIYVLPIFHKKTDISYIDTRLTDTHTHIYMYMYIYICIMYMYIYMYIDTHMTIMTQSRAFLYPKVAKMLSFADVRRRLVPAWLGGAILGKLGMWLWKKWTFTSKTWRILVDLASEHGNLTMIYICI